MAAVEHDERRGSIDQPALPGMPSGKASLWLLALVDHHQRQVVADATLDTLVAHARATGVTWEAVGAALGMTKQGAQKRWAAVER